MVIKVNSITVSELLLLFNPDIIDIRDNNLYREGHIPGANNIPIDFLLQDPSRYIKSAGTYYLYCDFGLTSSRICQVLSQLGYNVINIADGYYGYEILKK